MAVQTVACPGCKATLKAPEQMAGKKAKCRKCGVSFRIPGGPEPTGDSVGDSQFLSAMDLPSPATPPADNPFAFGGEPEPEPKPKLKEKDKPKPPLEKEKPKSVEKPPEKKPEPKVAKSSPKPPPAAKPVEEAESIPAAEAVDEEEPAPEATSDPFSFSPPSSKERSKEKPKDGKRDKTEPKAEAPTAAGNAFAFGDDSAPSPNLEPIDEDELKPVKVSERKKGRDSKVGFTPKPKPGGGGGLSTGKLLIAAAVFALVVGAVVGGVLIYLNSNKQPEQVNNEKKDPPAPPDNTPPTPPGPTPPPNKGENPKPPDPKEKSTPPKKDPPGKKPAGNTGGGGTLALAPGKTITFLPPSAKPEMVQEPNTRMVLAPTLPAKSADAFAAARKVFPTKKDIDVGVVWQTEKGLQNVGEKLLLGIYAPSGKQVNQVEIDGDGSPEPVCDLSADANLFAHAHTGQGKVTIWDTRTGARLVDGFNPYAMKNEVKLAAVYITEPPLFFITVSTAGDVSAFNVRNPKEAKPSKFAPAKPPTKPLVAGKHIAPGADRLSVMLFAGGSFYSVTVAPNVKGTELARLDGEVGRVFGLASSGKTVIAFETEDKKDRAVMEVRTDGNHVFHRWPDKDAGEPTAVAWVDDGLVMVATNRGSCLWFESEGKEFKPVALARTPKDKALHAAYDGHWALLPDPANPKQCVLVEYSKPQSGVVGALDSSKQPPIAILTDKGLLK